MLQTINRSKSKKCRQTSATIKKSEERYRRLMEAVQDGILILNARTGKISDVNSSLTAILGHSRAEIIGKKIWEQETLKEIAESREAFKKLRLGSIRCEDLPLQTKDGRSISVEFISNIYSVNGVKIIQCNIRDLTERKKVEQEKEKLIAELIDALTKSKTLRGVLTICSYCKSIYDGKGSWKKVEQYIRENSEANFSQEICPKCMKIFHPNEEREKGDEKPKGRDNRRFITFN